MFLCVDIKTKEKRMKKRNKELRIKFKELLIGVSVSEDI